MAVVPFDPSVLQARRAARAAQQRTANAGGQARQRTRPPEAPQPLPKLHVNVSPNAALRMLGKVGLGVAVCTTVAATLTMISSHGFVERQMGPPALERLAEWASSLPWLFLGVILFAVARIERVVRRSQAWSWMGLSIAAGVVAACQALGGFMTESPSPIVRLGTLIILLCVSGFVLRDFFRADSGAVRLQIAGGMMGGFAVAIAPLAMLGQAVLPAREQTTTLVTLLAGCDALLGLVVATVAVHATLVYVRDFLPDFTIALETGDRSAPAARQVATPRR
jgi:hypothetical protein